MTGQTELIVWQRGLEPAQPEDTELPVRPQFQLPYSLRRPRQTELDRLKKVAPKQLQAAIVRGRSQTGRLRLSPLRDEWRRTLRSRNGWLGKTISPIRSKPRCFRRRHRVRADQPSFISPATYSFPELSQWMFETPCVFSPYNLPYCFFRLNDFVPHFVTRPNKESSNFPDGSVVFQLRADHGGQPCG